ncbi:MAG: type II toxin-antitoxin system HicB family antitoxin [Nanoarchaeota archaeon]|nr:type II toxin-antitoxin system HicB family antitoxin [Nanoarchaeota archaeon]
MEEKIELDIVIVPEGDGEDRIYSIISIQVPNVATQGDSIEDAKRMLKEALELYFEEHPQAKKEIIKITKEESHAPIISRIFI